MKSAAFKIAAPEWVPPGNLRFFESHAKLYWARLHAHHVSGTWEKTVQLHTESVARMHLDPNQVGKPSIMRVDLPFSIGLLIGDCLHNMRGALDYLVSRLARDANISDHSILFPFNKTRSSLEASFDGNGQSRRAKDFEKLVRDYPNLGDVILNRIMPYSEGDGANPSGDLIWRINDANNIDKHRLITPVMRAVHMPMAKFKGGVTVNDLHWLGEFPDGMEVEDHRDLAFDILFEKPTLLATKPVTNTLVQACDAVETAIGIFESEFP